MKLQTFLIVGMIIELCLVPLLDAKRSFGITRSRNKNKGPSVRRNQHGTYDDNPVPPAVHHPKPSAPEIRKPVPYSNQPQGPPPAYPGMGHHSAAPYGAPPAYSPSYASPPGYSSYSNPGMGYNQPRFGQQGSFNQPGYGTPMGGGGGMNMGGGGGMGMGGGMGGMGGMGMGGSAMGGGYGNGYGRSSGFGSGIMTNLFAGLAGYQLAKAFSGGHHRDRETIIIDNRQLPVESPGQPTSIDPMAASIDTPESHQNVNVPTEIPQTPVNPTMNEYNFYGIPQYGVPLYGYSLPSQITDYYSTAIVAMPPYQPAIDETHQPMSRK